MKLKQSMFFVSLVFLCGLLLACKNNAASQIEYVQISEISVSSDVAELDLKNSNITDISPLYSLDSLTFVDLRNNDINPDDIITFIESKPNCEVLWSVPIFGQTFDNTSTTIALSETDTINASDIEYITKNFRNLDIIQLSSSNIASSDLEIIKAKYPEISFQTTVILCGEQYDSKLQAIDLSNCNELNENEIVNKLAYFNKLNSVLFGGHNVAIEFIQQLKEKYQDIDFEWQVQLLEAQYSSSISEIDISGNEINDFENFKNQLKHFESLSYIDMCDCGLTNMQMEELIELYPKIKFVWRIQVGSWEMRTDVKAFGTCYESDFEGGSYIGGNGFYLDDDEAINLKYCKDLIVLDIGHQYNINDYSFLQELDNIKYLIVALSNFEDTNLISHMKELEFLEIFNTNVADLSPLLELPNLKYLNCSQTLIPNVDYLVDMDQLEVLWLCNSIHISRKEAARLEESLPNCYINTTAQGSTRGGWRSYDNQGYIDMREALDMPLAFK